MMITVVLQTGKRETPTPAQTLFPEILASLKLATQIPPVMHDDMIYDMRQYLGFRSVQHMLYEGDTSFCIGPTNAERILWRRHRSCNSFERIVHIVQGAIVSVQFRAEMQINLLLA
jgi:hypothetical protein